MTSRSSPITNLFSRVVIGSSQAVLLNKRPTVQGRGLPPSTVAFPVLEIPNTRPVRTSCTAPPDPPRFDPGTGRSARWPGACPRDSRPPIQAVLQIPQPVAPPADVQHVARVEQPIQDR